MLFFGGKCNRVGGRGIPMAKKREEALNELRLAFCAARGLTGAAETCILKEKEGRSPL